MTGDPCRKSIVPRGLWGLLASSTLIGFVLAQSGQEGRADPAGAQRAANRYIGAERCKDCHQGEAGGDAYGHWARSGHAEAFETLASAKAKAIAKAKGIEDPQRSDRCMRCHQTAFGVAADEIKKGFDLKKGVQCESCHGPGEQHVIARFAAAAKGGGDARVRQTVPEGEIVANAGMKTCLACHNEESPIYKPFCVHELAAGIAHPDPRHKRDSGRLVCGCDAKEGCKHVCDDKCGGKPAPR